MVADSITTNVQKIPDYYGVNNLPVQAENIPVQQNPNGNNTLERSPSSDSMNLSTNVSAKPQMKKDGFSTGAKWAISILGTAATVYGGVVLHRKINKPTFEQVQKNFSEIFGRNVSKEEAQNLINIRKFLKPQKWMNILTNSLNR